MAKELNLVCLLWPTKCLDDAFETQISNELSVFKLKESIFCGPCRSRVSFANVASDLILWKCSVSASDDSWLETLNSVRFDASDDRVERLMGPCALHRYFTEDLPEESIHILIELPKSDGTPLSSLSLSIDSSIDNLLYQRKQFNSKISNKALPSQATSSNFATMQMNPEQAIAWSRPYTCDATVPVTLYHPVFRQFMDDCKRHQPSAEDNAFVLELSVRMSDFYEDDGARAADFRYVLRQHGINLSATVVHSKGLDFVTDGDIRVDDCRVVIFASSNEIGGGGLAEPYAQAILSYMHSTWPATENFPVFNFPCLILTLFGPHVSFSGALWNSRPHFQVLSPALPLFSHHTDIDMRTTLARHFGAFRKAIQSLTQCYEITLSGVPSSLDNYPDPRYPDLQQYHTLIDPEGPAVHFKYLYPVKESKLLFIAQTDCHGTSNTERVCVKFVRQYSRAVHEKCASMGISPRLRGFEDIGGGWTMVVMDVLDEEFVCIRDLTPEIPVHPGASESLKEALTELHDAGLVHGDVRSRNVLVRRNGGEGFVLVDFDWAGVVGEVRYPMNVFKGMDLWRPDGVSDGELIKPEHDMAMLECLLGTTSM